MFFNLHELDVEERLDTRSFALINKSFNVSINVLNIPVKENHLKNMIRKKNLLKGFLIYCFGLN